MKNGIIFDMDGVLVDSEKVKAEAWRIMLEKYRVYGGDHWYKRRAGTPGRKLNEKAIQRFSTIDAGVEELLYDRQNIYVELLKRGEIHPIESSIAFLKSIPKDEFKIGLASSEFGHTIELQMRHLEIYDIFDAVTSGVEEVENDKPAPDVYLLTAKKLGLRPEYCVAIEDSGNGVKAVKNAGIYCVGYANPNGLKQDISESDRIVEDLSELELKTLHDR